jgi:transposase
MSKIIHHLGLDVHKDSISVAIAEPSGEVRHYGTIGGKLADVDRLIKKLHKPDVELRFCYEAGPTGYVLQRHLQQQGFQCHVVAPSLIPKKPSDRVKTNRRDCLNLARLFRAGELTFVTVPDPEDEAIRDLVRARFSAIKDQRHARQKVKALLLRQGLSYVGKTSWTPAHLNYLARLKMPHPAQQIAFEEYKLAVTMATDRVLRLTRAMEAQLPTWKWKDVVAALMTLRGIQVINAMTLIAELGDLTRFADPHQLMSYLGLVSSEESTGNKRRQGSITKAGNEAGRRALIEAAHHYRLPARISPSLQQRQHGQSKEVQAIAWKAQLRLCSRYHHLRRQGKKPQVIVTALARELAGFVWAIACTSINKAPSLRPKPASPQKPAKIYQLKPPQLFRPRPAPQQTDAQRAPSRPARKKSATRTKTKTKRTMSR